MNFPSSSGCIRSPAYFCQTSLLSGPYIPYSGDKDFPAANGSALHRYPSMLHPCHCLLHFDQIFRNGIVQDVICIGFSLRFNACLLRFSFRLNPLHFRIRFIRKNILWIIISFHTFHQCTFCTQLLFDSIPLRQRPVPALPTTSRADRQLPVRISGKGNILS